MMEIDEWVRQTQERLAEGRCIACGGEGNARYISDGLVVPVCSNDSAVLSRRESKADGWRNTVAEEICIDDGYDPARAASLLVAEYGATFDGAYKIPGEIAKYLDAFRKARTPLTRAQNRVLPEERAGAQV